MADTDSPGHKVAHFRLPEDIHTWLTGYAKRTERSLNGAAVHILRQAMEQDTQPSSTLHTR